MSNNLEKSIFFAGGKIIVPEANEKNKGLRFERLKNGSWRILLDLKISKEEAEEVINIYANFHEVDSEEKFEKEYPNQVYFEAFEKKGNKLQSIDIQVRNIKLYVLNAHKTQEGGSIFFSMTPPTGIGKTQNAEDKTQNSAIDTSQP